MDPQDRNRANIALPNPQEQAGAPEIELLPAVPQQNTPRGKSASAPPPLTWSLLLKRELEFLGVTQILIGSLCFYFGIIIYSVHNNSNFDIEVFPSFKVGYPFWSSVFFVISGVLSVLSEREKAMYLVRGRLGVNTLSSIAGASAIVILVFSLRSSSAYIHYCEVLESEECLVILFTMEIVAMMLFLTFLGFCTTVLLTIYGIGEECKGKKLPNDRLYEELHIYAPIYSELEDKGETARVDS